MSYSKLMYKKAYELADAISQYRNSLNQEVAAFLRKQADLLKEAEETESAYYAHERTMSEIDANYYQCGEL